MPGGIETAEELVQTALVFAPWLLDIPVLGRILRIIAPTGGNETKALEELQRVEQKKKQERKTRIDKNARYVLKASDAMQCVENTVSGNGTLLLAIGKGILNTVSGRSFNNIPDLLTQPIFECIESKVLKQTGKRVKKTAPYYGRPAKGHGGGRGVTGKVKLPQTPKLP